jgi:hypothetical protein
MLVASLALAGASCTEPSTVELVVTTGLEGDTLTRAPEVVSLRLRAIDPEGAAVAQVEAGPGDAFELPEVDGSVPLRFEVTGATADGAEVVRGRSLALALGSVSGGALPVFVQRLDAFARPPGALERAHVHAPAGVLAERFLVATGGEAALDAEGETAANSGDFYDLAALGGSVSDALLPRAARSLVVRGSTMILIDEEGATSVDTEAGSSFELSAPSGLEGGFGAVSGARALDEPEGRTLVVGATRADAPSSAVLWVDAAGLLSASTIGEPRRGAGAAFVPGVGLVLVGGSAVGPGVVAIDPATTTARALPFPPDATEGAAAVVFGEQLLAVVGGRVDGAPAAARIFDLRCVADCAPEVVQSLAIEALAQRGEAFATSAGALVLGENDAGETLAWAIDRASSSVAPLLLRERRFGATATPAPNGTLFVLGGRSLSGAAVRTVESFFPR